MCSYSYKEYMENLLGYNMLDKRNNQVIQNVSLELEPYENENAYIDNNNNEIDEYYPEIYKIIYPVVCQKTLYVNANITEDVVERITDEVYNIIEKDESSQENRSVAKTEYINYRNMRRRQISKDAWR